MIHSVLTSGLSLFLLLYLAEVETDTVVKSLLAAECGLLSITASTFESFISQAITQTNPVVFEQSW